MNGELRILILEDRPADAELVMRELRKAGLQFVAKCVATEADFVAQLREAPPDLILADYALPAYDGLSALATARKERPEIPFIFVSGTMGEETAIDALHQGATDYVLKQRLTRLGPAVQRALREVEQLRHRAEAASRIRELNLLLHAIRDIAQLIVRERDSQRLLAEACNILVQTRGYALAWVGLVEPDSKRVVPAAWAGDQADYLDNARMTWDETPTGLGPTGTAMRAGQPCVCPDTATDARFGPWREAALARGYASVAATPMTHGKRIVGAVTVYSNCKNAFHNEEISLLRDLAGDLAFALQSIEDERERERAETALIESRGLLKAILDNIPDPAWLKDLQGRFLACNEPVARLCARKPEEILGKTVFDIIPSEAERMTREDQEAVAKGKPIRVEMAITSALGQKRWFDTIKSPVFNDLGEVTGTVGIARETTERRQTDEALQVSEDRFRSVWEHSIDGMRLTDRAGRILAVNEAFCRLVRLPRERLIGELFPVAFERPGAREDIEVYQRRFDAGTFEPRQTAHLRLWNSEELDLEISCSFVESGLQCKTLLSIFRDVGDRKRAEARVAAFSHLGQQLSAATSAREAGEIIVAAADQLLGWDACSFALYSAAENLLDDVLCRDTVDGWRIEGSPDYVHSPPSLLARRVIEEGGQLILKEKPDQAVPGGMAFGNKARPSASILFVPARAEAEVVAVLSIHSYTPKAYDQRGLETLQVLADHCAGALKRIRAQEALSTSEANYRSLVECSPDAIVLHRDGTFLYANPAALKLFGAEKQQQVLELSVFDTVPPENHDLIGQRIRCAARGETTPLLEQTIVRLDGTALDIEATSSLFTYEGKPAVQTVMRNITERKRAGEALAQERHLLRTLIDNLPDYIFVKDAQSRFVLNNQAHLALLKAATQAEVVGKTDGDIFPSELAAGYYADEQAVLRSGEPSVNHEESTVDPAGQVRWLLTTKVPLRDGQGKITRLVGVSRDITERKLAELRLTAFSRLGQWLSAAKTAREAGEIIVEVADQLLGWDACSFALYSSAENLLDYVLSRDTVDGRRIEGSPSYEKSPPSPLARRVIEEGAQLILKEKPDQPAPGGVAFGNEARPSASILFVPARAGAEVVGVLSIHSYTPNTYDQRGLETLQLLADHCAGALKRIRAQEALSASEANYRSLVENIPQKIFVKDQNFRWVSVNENFARELGLRPEEIVGKTDYDFYPKDLADKYRADDERIMRTGQAEELEEKHLQDGREIWVNVVKSPMRNERAEITGVFGIFWDITERRKLEEQFRQSQKMEAIGQLAGGVAHDFNNMLAVIRGNAELLLMDADQHPPATNECLKQITAASERAANLTRQLLAFSRKQVMQAQPLALNKVIAEVTKMLKRIIGEQIALECRYADPLPFVRADAGMIEQVLLNLAVNARDAMPRGGRLLIATDTASFDAAYVHSHPEARAGEFVRLTVTDTGTGIAPEHLPRIFEPFFTTKALGKGTGLGLATVYGIVQQHQGWIEVSSRPGAGATFRVFLPVIPSPAAAAASKAETQVPGGAETILLVEDEYAVRAITRRVLESRGYRIYEATTVREALEVWRSHAEEIDLLLTDIVMPQGLTGRELTEQLRAQRPALKVIFMSGYSADVIGKDTGFFRRTKGLFLQKPCSARTILETVRRCLDEK